jgi:methionyl-tRNA formyltransferase
MQPVVEKVFDPSAPFVFHSGLFKDFYSIGNRFGVEVLTPPDRDINACEFVDELEERFKPTIGLSFGCPQIFGHDLLQIFQATMNNHSGLLPEYRGWAATEWSLYEGEEFSGFSYHRMTEGVDAGSVLCSGEIPVGNMTLKQIELAKCKLAAAHLEEALRLLISGSEGQEHKEKGHLRTRKETEAITHIDKASELSWAELQRRLRAFGALEVRLGNRVYRVTKFKPLATNKRLKGHRQFTTKDGVPVGASRFAWLPFQLFRLVPNGFFAEVPRRKDS